MKKISLHIIDMLTSCKEADPILDELPPFIEEENLDLILLPNLNNIRDLVESYILESGELWLIVKDLPRSIQIPYDYIPYFGNYETYDDFKNIYENEKEQKE